MNEKNENQPESILEMKESEVKSSSVSIHPGFLVGGAVLVLALGVLFGYLLRVV